MTQIEYITKRDRIAVSEASTELKEEAMNNLNKLFYIDSSIIDRAKQQMEDSLPDVSDIGNES